MLSRGLAILLVPALGLGVMLLDSGANCQGAPEGQGHGGGGGHTPAPAYRGGYRGYWGGYRHYGGWGYPGVGFGVGLGYGWGYPYYGYYYDGCVPIYVDPGYYGPGFVGYPAPVYQPTGSAAVSAPAPVGQGTSPGSGPAPPVRLTDTNVLFSVRVPSDAIVWFNGFKTDQTGPRREFASAGLAPGRTYTFDIRARWTGQDGKIVDVDRRISVQGGERRTVDFLN
jgi:uncharacterized protein (TIGR03000 family)